MTINRKAPSTKTLHESLIIVRIWYDWEIKENCFSYTESLFFIFTHFVRMSILIAFNGSVFEDVI